MTRFLKTNAGFIDLTEVAGAQAIQTGGRRLHGHSRPPGTATKFLDEAGRELGVGGEIDLERLTSPLEEPETFDQKPRRADYHPRSCYDGTVTPNHDLNWHHRLTEDTPWLPMDFVPDVAADRWCAGSWRRVRGHRIVIRQYIRD